MLRIKNLNLIKKQTNILHTISIECAPGTITALIGKSGAGKTSLLKCVGQLDQTYCGSVEFNAKDLIKFSQKEKAELIGFVFQQFNLFPHMTILENCSNPLRIVKKYDTKKADSIALATLEKFGLKNLADSYPINISGGQQQRAAIARALCFNPQIICLDEPSSALDPENTALLITTLKTLAQAGTTIVLSSQDMPFVKAIADKIVMLENGTVAEEYSKDKQAKDDSKISNFMDFMN